ncbi:DUF4153 domain-containing protein [Glaciecola sp. MH2013]|uniref:DUF4153 domain-containing protein n=1 Tax=Glaciecola sp. MH2013 TaxID=2785524 RepID=UPI00189DA568|nr:DUF4153 domain-containing protein [Glaciecola sp. MH2013]MBF7073201.1 DUF4153 domain-containing protein [Glaciecola sp. MH2013]
MSTNTTLENQQLSKVFISLIALVQGLLLALLYHRLEVELWPFGHFSFIHAFATILLFTPTLFLLVSTRQNWKKALLVTLPYCLLLATIAAYVGSLIIYHYSDQLTFVFTLCALISTFKVTLYTVNYANGTPFSYASLFHLSFRYFILATATVLFSAILFTILFLGAELFEVLGISIFSELLADKWVWVPTLTLSVALAINVFRSILHTVDVSASIVQTLFKFLLPFLVIISLGFAATLPFTGLQKLWDTGSGTSLVLWLQALTLFFVNAVYHEGNLHRPYKALMHRLIMLGLVLLPIYSIIGAYGLWLRIDQYGLTVSRAWATVVCALLACFAFGYLLGIIRLGERWQAAQSKINVGMGIVVAVGLLLINTPFINFYSLSASSQLARLDDGKVSLEEFDFDYFVYSLHAPGKEALDALKADIAESNPDIVALIDKKYSNRTRYSGGSELDDLQVETIVSFFPEKSSISSEFMDYLQASNILNDSYPSSIVSLHIIAIDMDEDGSDEYLVVHAYNWGESAALYSRMADDNDAEKKQDEASKEQASENLWQRHYVNVSSDSRNAELSIILNSEKITLEERKWKKARIGPFEFIVQD